MGSCWPSIHSIQKQHVQAVHVGAVVGVLREGDYVAAAFALDYHERFVRELLAILLPDVAAGHEIVWPREPDGVDAFVQLDGSEDGSAAYEDVHC